MVKSRLMSLLAAACVAATLSCDKDPTAPIVPSLPDPGDATVFVHDQVDDENEGVGIYNWTDFEHWEVLDGCVDLHGNGFVDVQQGHGLYIDLDGTCLQGGTIQSRVAFQLEPGDHVLEFWLAGNQRISAPDTVLLTFGELYSEEIVLPRNQPFTLFTRPVAVPTATEAHLRFQNLGGDDRGALLDEVRVRTAQ